MICRLFFIQKKNLFCKDQFFSFKSEPFNEYTAPLLLISEVIQP